ncbi:MAG: hypothetical protein WCW78_03750 [Candidatus Paceibacterota bacterium]|jgi:uncharacterized protein YecA (UPF0149 family)
MKKLDLDIFLATARDPEQRHYEILAILKEYKMEFAHSRLYPALAHLAELHAILTKILENKGKFDKVAKREIDHIDIEKKQIVYKPLHENSSLKEVISFINRVFPDLEKVISEGAKIYDFAESCITLSPVGIASNDERKGYLIAADTFSELLHVHRFSLEIWNDASKKVLVMEEIHSAPWKEPTEQPETIKAALVQNFPDLSNPATFFSKAEFGFPYEETVFPILQRKLLATLHVP